MKGGKMQVSYQNELTPQEARILKLVKGCEARKSVKAHSIPEIAKQFSMTDLEVLMIAATAERKHEAQLKEEHEIDESLELYKAEESAK